MRQLRYRTGDWWGSAGLGGTGLYVLDPTTAEAEARGSQVQGQCGSRRSQVQGQHGSRSTPPLKANFLRLRLLCAVWGGALAGKPLQLWMHLLLEGQCIVFLLLKILSPTLYSLLTLTSWSKQAEPEQVQQCTTGLQTYPGPQSTLRCFHVTRDRNMSTGEPTAITTYTL